MELRFVASESRFAYFEALKAYLRRHGKPVAFYSDKHSEQDDFFPSGISCTLGDIFPPLGRHPLSPCLPTLAASATAAGSFPSSGGASAPRGECLSLKFDRVLRRSRSPDRPTLFDKILCITNDKVAKDSERDRNVPLDPPPIFERKHYRHCDDDPCKSEHGLHSPLRSLPLSISMFGCKGIFGARIATYCGPPLGISVLETHFRLPLCHSVLGDVRHWPKGHRNAATADYLPNGPVPEALRSTRLWIRWSSMRTVST